jgi:hypothetical protein
LPPPQQQPPARPQACEPGADEVELPPCAANTDNFFVNFFEPQCGQATEPSQFAERTSDSKSFSHLLQTNS